MSQQVLLHQAQVIDMKVKIVLVIMIFTPLFVYFYDKHAAKFGNGIYNHYSELNFGMRVTKINQVYITYDKNWKYESYLAPQIEYETQSRKIFKVKKVVGYCLLDKAIIIRFKDDINQLIEFSFNKQSAVYINKPTVKVSNFGDCKNYIDLTNPPYMVRNWGYINILSYLAFFMAFIIGVLSYIRTKRL